MKSNPRRRTITNYLHKGDLPEGITFKGDIAIDTETKGLEIFRRDRLCLVQISDGREDAHLVQFPDGKYNAPRLKKLLADEKRVKIFHYARFDIAALKIYLDVEVQNIYCTKIASKLTRTYSDKHSLKEICKELLNVDISKQQQCSNWGAEKLTREQIDYAASDVLYLHALREKLDPLLEADNRKDIAKACFDFLPTRVALDELGWQESDIFRHD